MTVIKKQLKQTHSTKMLVFLFTAVSLAALSKMQHFQDCMLNNNTFINSEYKVISSTRNVVTTQDNIFHDACISRPPTNMSKQLVEAKAVDVSFKMSVYGFDGGIVDIVSRVIRRDKVWEPDMTKEMMALFPCIDGEECQKDGSFTKRHGTLLDVGANIGWYSVVAAHLGHNVVSFEPFNKNADLICSSKEHLQEEKKNNWRLFQLGLDFKQRHCQMFQQKNKNIGDTHSICNEKTRESYIKWGLEQLGWMNTTTLDFAMQQGVFDRFSKIDVMNIDVEGFEPKVLAGANSFFESKYAPTYIFMEFTSRSVGMSVGSADVMEYMKTILINMKNHGYEILTRPGQTFQLSLQNSTLNDIVKEVDGKDLLFFHVGYNA